MHRANLSTLLFTQHFYQIQTSPRSQSHVERASLYSEYRYAYLRTLLPLLRHRANLAAQEDEARRKRDAQFPTSAAEYRTLQDKDIQQRIARFLMANKLTKEKMMSEFGWVYRQVKTLEDEYDRDASIFVFLSRFLFSVFFFSCFSFCAALSGSSFMVMERPLREVTERNLFGPQVAFRSAIQISMREVEVKDPRRKASAAS